MEGGVPLSENLDFGYRKSVKKWLPKLLRVFVRLAPIVALIIGIQKEACANDSMLMLRDGKITILQRESKEVRFVLASGDEVIVEDTAGFYWPPIQRDSKGKYYLGNKILSTKREEMSIDRRGEDVIILGRHYRIRPRLGKFGGVVIERDRRSCSLVAQDLKLPKSVSDKISPLSLQSISFVDSDGPLVGLLRAWIGDGPGDLRFWTVKIDPANCKVHTTELGNPDNLIEIGWSPEGHWWITGSIETTLLRSKDGEHWTPIVLSPETSQLISAYVESDHEIWLAANDARTADNIGPSIVHSDDSGQTWKPLKWGDPLLKRLPSTWFEGQMRVNGRVVD